MNNKYWIRNRAVSTKFQTVTFGYITEVTVPQSEASEFEAANPDAEMVGDGSEMDEKYRPVGDTVFGPAFPFGPDA